MHGWLKILSRYRGALSAAILLCVWATVLAPMTMALRQTGECAEKCCRREKAKAHACCKRTHAAAVSSITGDHRSCCDSEAARAFGRISVAHAVQLTAVTGMSAGVGQPFVGRETRRTAIDRLSHSLFERPPPAV